MALSGRVEIEHVEVSRSGQARFTLSGQLGQAYLLEKSTHWQMLAASPVPSARFVLVDQTAAQSDCRFYRVRTAENLSASREQLTGW
jgi:hypothetical protein